jgi:hypothetical protein
MPVIEVVSRNVAFKEVPPSGAASLGDQIFFTDDPLNAQNQVVGTHSGFCTLLRVTPGAAPALYQCQATFTLPQGQITARGAFTIPSVVGQLGKAAITGGTDIYASARGQANVTQLAQGERLVLDIVL